MDWPAHLARLSAEGTPFAVVTVADVRGHAPCAPGAKLIVTATGSFGTVGGGYLEWTALRLARSRLGGAPGAWLEAVRLNARTFPVQCCGGEVTLLLEVPPGRRAVAVFGVGHVGLHLARVLALSDLDLHLVDSRPGFLDPARLGLSGLARVFPHPFPTPESAVPKLPPGTPLVVMTHDHAEDLAVLDMALRRPDLPWLGLIGSATKWAHFRGRLLEEGHPPESLSRIVTPVGLGEPSKDPPTIAVAVAAQLLQVLEAPVSAQTADEPKR